MYTAITCPYCKKYVHYTTSDIKMERLKYDHLGSPVPETQLLLKSWIVCPWCRVRLENDNDIEIPEDMFDAAYRIHQVFRKDESSITCCIIL